MHDHEIDIYCRSSPEGRDFSRVFILGFDGRYEIIDVPEEFIYCPMFEESMRQLFRNKYEDSDTVAS